MKGPLLILAAASLLCSSAYADTAAAKAPGPSFARPNRLALSLGVGFGSAGMGRFHEAVDEIGAWIERSNPGITVELPKSNLQINAEIAFRYYFPYYVLAQVGYGALYNAASSTFSAGTLKGTLEHHNLVMEVPILLGGYYPFFGRLFVHGAVGPSVFFFSRSWWDASPGGISDFKADGGVGFHALAGADYFLAEHFAVGLEVRYRYVETGDLQDLNYGQVVTSHMFRGDGSTETYQMDFSGVSLALNLRFFIL